MNVLAIGVAFTDIKGFPFGKYIPCGTNKGSVRLTHGGVMRNVAEDMALIGMKVEYPQLLEEGTFGESVAKRLKDAGVCLDNAVYVKENGIGKWLAVFNENGDLAGSISEMPDVSPIERLLEEKGDELFKNCDFAAVEFDTSEFIAEKCMKLALKYRKDVFVPVGNMSVILARKDLMLRTRCIIMNNIEAGRLFGRDLSGLSPEETLRIVLREGMLGCIRAIIVTLGGKGCVYADFENEASGYVPAQKCEIVDTTGAGDAFFSAAACAISKGMSIRRACELGSRLAALTIATDQSACPYPGEDFFG